MNLLSGKVKKCPSFAPNSPTRTVYQKFSQKKRARFNMITQGFGRRSKTVTMNTKMNTQPINSYDYVQFFAASANTEITARLWDALMANKPRAIVVESFGSGSIPGILIDKVQTATRNGTAVFLLNGASKQNYGIIKLTYDTNTRLLEAGAVPLERINIGHLRRWAAFIDEGTRSADLPKYSGDKTDALLQTIAEIAQHESNMFELIRKVRETYRLSDEQIEEIVRNSHRKELVEISHEIKSALSQENA